MFEREREDGRQEKGRLEKKNDRVIGVGEGYRVNSYASGRDCLQNVYTHSTIGRQTVG